MTSSNSSQEAARDEDGPEADELVGDFVENDGLDLDPSSFDEEEDE